MRFRLMFTILSITWGWTGWDWLPPSASHRIFADDSFKSPQSLVYARDRAELYVLAIGPPPPPQSGIAARVAPGTLDRAAAMIEGLLGNSERQFDELGGIVPRAGNRFSIVGRTKEKLRVLTFRWSEGGTSATWVKEQSTDLPMNVEKADASKNLEELDVRSVVDVASTDFAIYAIIHAKDGRSFLFRVPANLEKAQPIANSSTDLPMTALTMSPQGHLVVALSPLTSPKGKGTSRLRFCHAESGRSLLEIETDAEQIDQLGYDASGALLALGQWKEQRHVFLLSASLHNGVQSAVSSSIAAAPHARDFAAGTQNQIWSLRDDGQIERLRD